MPTSLWWFVLVVGLSEGFTPSASVGGSATGVNGNMVDRTWDPLEHSEVASYYPGPRPWSSPAGSLPHFPNNYGLSLPPASAPSCWSTPTIAGAAIISILAIGAVIAAKLPLILLAPVVLTVLALPLALPLLAPVIALAFMLPMPTEDNPIPGAENGEMPAGMMAKPPDDPKKPANGANPDGATARLWSALNDDGQQCLQKLACQLGRHAGDTGTWMVKKLPESEWRLFREAYSEGSRSANQSDSVCGKFQCSAQSALLAMSAATPIPGT